MNLNNKLDKSLLNKLFLQTIFRIVFIVLITLFDIVTVKDNDNVIGIKLKILFIVITIMVSIFYLFLIKFYHKKKFLLYLQIFLDSIFTTLLLFIIKSNNFLIVFLYILNITNSSILFFRKGAILSAFLSYGFTVVVFIVKSDLEFLKIVEQSEFWKINLTNLSIYFSYSFIITLFTEQLDRQETIIKINQNELQYSNHLKQAVVDNIESGILVTDNLMRIVFLNKAGEQILENPLSYFKNKKLDIISLGCNEKKNKYEIILNKKIIGCSKNQILKNNKPDGQLIIFKDLTETKQIEDRLKRNERLAYIGEMTASIAHDIRNPLAAISASIQMIDKFSKDEKIKRLTAIGKKEINRLDNLIKEFLEYSMLDNLVMEEINLPSFLNDIENLYKMMDINITINYNNFSNLSMNVDKNKIHQVFVNLIQNSIESIKKDEKIIKIYPEFIEDKTSIIIEDNGEGIDDEILNDIFNPFYTTKNKGTGLGLSIVSKLIDLHKGRIEVESTLKEGTKFKLFLNIKKSENKEMIS